MIIVSSDSIPGKNIIHTVGLISTTVKKPFHISFKDLKNAFSANENDAEANALWESDLREKAIQKLIEKAEALGANAIISIRFYIGPYQSATLNAYGTAVVIEE